jgi:hypothetical protein
VRHFSAALVLGSLGTAKPFPTLLWKFFLEPIVANTKAALKCRTQSLALRANLIEFLVYDFNFRG